MRLEEALPMLRDGKTMKFDGHHKVKARDGKLIIADHDQENWIEFHLCTAIFSEHWEEWKAPVVCRSLESTVNIAGVDGRIARKSWEDKRMFAAFNVYGALVRYNGPEEFKISYEDILAKDWYVFE